MKKHGKRTPLVLSISILCFLLAGCGQADTPLYDPNDSGTANTTTAPVTDELSVPVETTSIEQDQLPPLRKIALDLAQDSNADSMFPLSFMTFTDEEMTTIDADSLPVQDGKIEMMLNILIYSPDEEQKAASGTMVMIWNGQIYDFTVDGKQSTDGSLTMQIPYNEDVLLPFTAEDLPVVEDDNSFSFVFIPYCEETGTYLTSQKFDSHYNAKQTREGKESVHHETEDHFNAADIIEINDRDAALNISVVQDDDRISVEFDRYTVHANPTFLLNISNASNIEGPANRSGIVMFCVDGVLQPVWNDAKYAYIETPDTVYAKSIQIHSDFKAGETHNILTVYAELKDDKNTYSDPFIYTQPCYCTVEE